MYCSRLLTATNFSSELTLFEKDADKVSTGQKIRFFINNETEQHEAVIYQTGKSINADKTYKVYASVQGTCKNVLPGMYVNAIIESTSNEVVALLPMPLLVLTTKITFSSSRKTKKKLDNRFLNTALLRYKKAFPTADIPKLNFLKVSTSVRQKS